MGAQQIVSSKELVEVLIEWPILGIPSIVCSLMPLVVHL